MNKELEDLLATYNAGYGTQENLVKEIFAARDKWWVEKLFAKCPHSSDFKIAAECMICLRSFTGNIELKREVGQ